MTVTYASYLRLDELLALQQPREGDLEHDETLFIIIHQVYELWFKEVLHELDRLVTLLSAGDTARSLHTFKRVLTILKVMVGQIDVLETMTPLGFLSFRDRLESGSGFQSFQFREIECLIGSKNPAAVARYPEGSPHRERIARRLRAPTLWDAFLGYLVHNDLAVPSAVLERDVAQPIEANRDLQTILIAAYRGDSVVAQICERLVDLDEGLMEWRYRHVKMVQRTIGAKLGTGGSAGAEYLMTTLHKPAFPDLWAIRSEL